jgi:S1-C subfamily serine protease
MHPEDPVQQRYAEPRRRLRPRVILAALVAVAAVAAAAVVPGHMHAHSRPVGTGVVLIDTNLAYQGAQAAGTGMVLTSSGEVLTNNHVIKGATELKVEVPSTGRSYDAEVVGYDVADDVAVLQLRGASDLQTVSLGHSGDVGVGDAVLALGNAGGTGRLTPASGTVTNTNRAITVSDDQGGSESLSGLIETNAAVRPGDSGGPLFNSSHEVIGMDTAASTSNQADVSFTNQGYAIPIDRALSIVDQITGGNESATVHIGGTAFLGVLAETSSYDVSGAVVTQVVAGSPAEAAGIVPGDVITSIGGSTISSPDDLSAAVSTQKPGASVTAVYYDQYGTAQTTNLTLGSGPPR